MTIPSASMIDIYIYKLNWSHLNTPTVDTLYIFLYIYLFTIYMPIVSFYSPSLIAVKMIQLLCTAISDRRGDYSF